MSSVDQDASGVDAIARKTGTQLKNGDEVLLRQIHPNLYLDGKIASTAFMPTADDNGELSVDRSSLTTPIASYRLYVENGRTSAAVYGVSVKQFEDQGISCHSDPLPETDDLKANPAHAYADFKGIENFKKQKRVAQRLRDQAVERGRLYPT